MLFHQQTGEGRAVKAVLSQPISAEAAEPVSVQTFVRAESDHMLHRNMEIMGIELGKLSHLRELTSVDNQPIIRMNVDMLYSATVLDLSSILT